MDLISKITGYLTASFDVVTGYGIPFIVILTLLATHRVSRKTYLPFGPFFIIAALWAVLLRP